MDNELVTGSESNAATGGGSSRLPVVSRYGEKFDELCGYYMSLGMSYSDYWDGDNEMPKYYREMAEKQREHENELLWLQGLYFYEALLDAAPVINPMSKKHQPLPYRSSPIPLSEAQSEQIKKEENRQKLENGKAAMQRIMMGVNQKFKEGGK